MTSQEISAVDSFVATTRESGVVWGLYCDDGWVICDSTVFEETDVMPFWSTLEAALIHCVDEWEDFSPVSISIEEFIEQWLVDLAQDGVLLGPDWNSNLSGEEVEPVQLVEKYLHV